MSNQPEALRLAGALQQQAVWEGHYGPSYLRDLLPEAAAELRRLSEQTDRDTALLRQALEALCELEHDTFHPAKVFKHKPTITALRERLKEKT